jgi:hypothetical protein
MQLRVVADLVRKWVSFNISFVYTGIYIRNPSRGTLFRCIKGHSHNGFRESFFGYYFLSFIFLIRAFSSVYAITYAAHSSFFVSEFSVIPYQTLD